jgi:hypothetical protein
MEDRNRMLHHFFMLSGSFRPLRINYRSSVPAFALIIALSGLLAGCGSGGGGSNTGSNGGGGKTVTVQPPTLLMYPQTTIGTYVGRAITPDIPATAGGAVTSFTVNPALPPGLNLNPTTGVISGTSTAAAAKATYVVTASNSGGSVEPVESPSITVTEAPHVLLQLGNQHGINSLQFANSSVLSQDQAGFWILWNYTSGAILASGDAGLGWQSIGINSNGNLENAPPAQMAGPTLVIGIAGGLEVLSSADGHLLSTIFSPGFTIQPNATSAMEIDSWQLASDGSYIALETMSNLYVYTPGGQLVFSRPGNYLQDNNGVYIFAAPGQVQVANGPAGANAIETISVPSGASTVSPAYQGSFGGWFTDGGRFFTGLGNIGWIYSSAGVQQALVQFPDSGTLISGGGTGNWVWTFGSNSAGEGSLSVYPIGSTTAALTVANSDIANVFSSGTTLGLLPDNYGTISVINLSGATPVKTDYAVPPPINHAHVLQYPVGLFAAVSSTQWVVGINSNYNGVGAASGLILDGASLSTSSPRYLGPGAALSIAGSANNVAIATEDGQISYFNPAETTPEGSISLTSKQVELSSDGSVLAASSQDGTLLDIYSLPSDTVSDTFSYSSQSAPGLLTAFTLSASGATLGQIIGSTSQVTPVSGSPVIWSCTAANQNVNGCSASILLSPDGTLIAVNSGGLVVTIYQNGKLLTAVTGFGVGWIDNGRLLVNNYGLQGDSDVMSYLGCTIYSPTGVALATPPLPQLGNIQPVTSDTVYASAYVSGQYAIYSLTTGQATWTSPYPPDSSGNPIGAVSGPYVVYESEGSVVAVNY